MSRDAYRDAGVDIEAGDALVEQIGPLAASTHREGVVGGIGGFGGLFRLPQGYRDPILVSGTDGVGTKLLLAQRLGRHATVGIDLVAMCVNDIVVSGAEPLFFLDYFATGALDPNEAAGVISGIAEGCRQAGCALLGGETAEMPGMYGPGHYDLAGFAVGVVERSEMLTGERIEAGDSLVGLPSTGVHSNGYSLVRKLLVDTPDFEPDAVPEPLDATLGDTLMQPTKIYVRDVLDIRDRFDLRGAAHITGGGLPGNLPRILPAGLGAVLDESSWPLPPIFSLLERAGSLSKRDLYRTFNMGLGMVLVVPADQADDVATHSGGYVIGRVVEDADARVRID